MAEHQSGDYHSCVSTLHDLLNVLYFKSGDAFDSSLDSENYRKFKEISDRVKEQEELENDNAVFEHLEDVSKAFEATINNIEKFKSEDPLEITRSVLDIISSAAQLLGVPCAGPTITALYIIIGWILTKFGKPQQPSVVDQLAKVVHEELVHFNKRLHEQKYDGVKRRVLEQNSQLRTMTPGEKLDDPNLWNDYVQFMGELSNRFESPLPFKYEDNLREDPDVDDFVIAVVTYCEAYCCFMALLFTAKGKFAELGSAYKEDENAVDRKISCQLKDAKEKLSFLSEERYLSFLGRLPCEGGKLTKIVALTRDMRRTSMVEAVRGSLHLLPMQDLDTVEDSASKVARQFVKIKGEERHQLPRKDQFWFEPRFWVQFINETDFPMNVVSGTVGRPGFKKIVFEQNVEPHSSFYSGHRLDFSTCGYIKIEPSAGQVIVFEFALSSLFYPKINIQDKTSGEFSRGKDTLKKMKSGKTKTLFRQDNEVHFMARADIFRKDSSLLWPVVWRFVIQDFDPCSSESFITVD